MGTRCVGVAVILLAVAVFGVGCSNNSPTCSLLKMDIFDDLREGWILYLVRNPSVERDDESYVRVKHVEWRPEKTRTVPLDDELIKQGAPDDLIDIVKRNFPGANHLSELARYGVPEGLQPALIILAESPINGEVVVPLPEKVCAVLITKPKGVWELHPPEYDISRGEVLTLTRYGDKLKCTTTERDWPIADECAINWRDAEALNKVE